MLRGGVLWCAVVLASGGAARAQVETVVVTGEHKIPSAKLSEPVLATPQSITVIPAEVMQQQGAYDLRDILRNDPDISLHADEDSGQGTNVTIRGFSARFDIYLDGMLDVGSYYRDGFNLAEVDVLTGPSSVLFGRGSTGGVIQQVSKTPQPSAFYDPTAAGGTAGTARFALDLNQPLSDALALRLNVLSYQGGISGRDIAHYDRFGIAPVLSYSLPSTQIALFFFQQSEWDVPDYGVPWIDVAGHSVSEPAHVPHRAFYGFTSDRADDSISVGTLLAEHEIDSALTLRNQLRYGVYNREFLATDPQVLPVIAAGTPFAAISVARTMRGGNSKETTLDDQLDLTARFETFGLGHTLIAGLEAARMTSDPTQYKFSGVPAANLLAPDPLEAFAGTRAPKSIVHASVDTVAAYAVDTIKLDRFAFTAAARLDDYAANFTNAVPAPVHLRNSDVISSYRAAAVYSATPSAILYIEYGTSFDPSAEGLSLSGATAGLGPERNRTVEAGAKWSATPGLLVTGALFRTITSNLREPSPLDPAVDVLEGVAQAQGFAIEAQGRISANWSLLAGYTFLDGRVLSSPNPDSGATLQDAPRHSLKLWSTYDLPFGFMIGGGIDYQSSRIPGTLPDANGFMQKVPGYWTSSAMAGYRLTEHLAVQLNVSNLFDAYYYDDLDDNHVTLGAGRAALFTFRATY